MKKVMFFILCVFVIFNSSAQTSFGVKASYLIPSYSWNFTPKNFNESTSGVSLGVILEHKLNEKVALQGELLYSIYNLDITDKKWYHFNYLELPLIGKYYIIDGLNIQGGLKFGFKLDAGGGMEQEIKSEDISSLNILLPIGIGYKFKFGLFTDLRYNVGLYNVNSNDKDMFIDNISAIELGLGYFF